MNSPCCFLQDSQEEEEKNEEEFVLGNEVEILDLLDIRVDNLSKEGRALTVTNNWQPFNNQTCYPASGQLSYGSLGK